MAEVATLTVRDYRSDIKPTWCPGCGDFAVLSATFKALADLQIPQEEIVVVSGIGCSSRIPYFLCTYGIHGLHGRALPLATGVKLANPELTVFAMGGDGDLFSIGAGHMPHAARRNVDITCICMDNQVYGLTKAQVSPTSKQGHTAKSTPYGTVELPINPVALALAGGASFVARGYSAKPKQLEQLIVDAVQHPGFAFIHVQSPCTEFHNTFNYYNSMVEDIDPNHDPSDLEAALRLALTEEREHLGLFYKKERPSYERAVRALEEESKAFDPREYLARYQ